MSCEDNNNSSMDMLHLASYTPPSPLHPLLQREDSRRANRRRKGLIASPDNTLNNTTRLVQKYRINIGPKGGYNSNVIYCIFSDIIIYRVI